MATWQQLYEMLLDEQLSPEQIVDRLHVRPSRLRQLLESKRLAARLEALADVAGLKASFELLGRVGQAVGRLLALAEAQPAETSRRASLDVLRVAREVYEGLRAQRQQAEQERAERRRRRGEPSERSWTAPAWGATGMSGPAEPSLHRPQALAATVGAASDSAAASHPASASDPRARPDAALDGAGAAAGQDGLDCAGVEPDPIPGPRPAGWPGKAGPRPWHSPAAVARDPEASVPPPSDPPEPPAAEALRPAGRARRPAEATLDSVLAEAARRRRWRELIEQHGGLALTRRRWRGGGVVIRKP